MNLKNKGTVLLTGATGFLGPYVASALRQTGWRVRAAVRQGDLDYTDETTVIDSMSPATDWRSVLAGVRAVVHLAALTSAYRKTVDREGYLKINTDSTFNLALQAANAGVRHFAFLSSISVNGPTTDGRPPFRETDVATPLGDYAQTKLAAEHGLHALAERFPLSFTIVRPPMIYGRNTRNAFHSLQQAISRSLPLPFASVHNRRAFVAAENVASFITFSLERPISGIETYIVADNEQLSTPEFIRRVGRALRRRPLLFPLPPAVLKLMLRAAGKPELILSTVGSLEVDTSKVRATGWQPILTMDEGLARAVQTI